MQQVAIQIRFGFTFEVLLNQEENLLKMEEALDLKEAY